MASAVLAWKRYRAIVKESKDALPSNSNALRRKNDPPKRVTTKKRSSESLRRVYHPARHQSGAEQK